MNVQIMERILNMPAVQRILEDDQGARLADRKKLAAQLVEERKGVGMPALRVSEDKAKKEMELARTAFKQAEQGWLTAQNDVTMESHRITRVCGELETQLSATAPESIARFIGEMQMDLEKTRKVQICSTPIYGGGFNLAGGEIKTGFQSNYPSVLRRMEAIREAIAAAKAMKFEALDEMQTEQRLQEMRDSLPAVKDEFQKTA